MEEMSSRPGVIDFSNRIVRELLRTPKFKAQLRALLNSLDPPAATELVRTLMWEDAELFLDLIGVFPELLNTLFIGGRELAEQLNKYPDPMLAAFLARVVGKIDGESLGRLIVALVGAYRGMRQVDGDPLRDQLSELGRKVHAGIGRNGTEILLSLLVPFLKGSIKKLADEAADANSDSGKLVRGLSGALAEAIRENPGFVEHVWRPFREALAVENGR